MKKFLKWLIYIIISVFLLLLVFYKFNPIFNTIVNIELMNFKTMTVFEVKGKELYMSNLINSQTYNQFVEIIKKNPQIKTIVETQIDGSIDDDTMIKLSYYIREKKLNTKLLSYSDINSGGVDLFLAGVERTMEKGAHIGIHSWSDGSKDAKEFPKESEEHEQNRKYIEDMLGKDDFYWFTIYAAPANGIKEMSEVEINKYGLLTKPIITKNLTKTNKLPGNLASKLLNNGVFGNANADTIVINIQGGPITFLDEMFVEISKLVKLDLNKTTLISVHQEQTLRPWEFKESITFDQAKKYDETSVKYVTDLIKYYKNKGKRVLVIGVSFGAFITIDSIATYGNTADKYLIMVGRLNMPKTVWQEFAKGNYVGFEYAEDGSSKVIKFNAEQAGMGGSDLIEDKNMAKLAAGLGYKRYITLLKDIDLSNVMYVYGKTDEQVGRLTKEEIDFLKLKKATVLGSSENHSKTIDKFIVEGVKFLNVPTTK